MGKNAQKKNKYEFIEKFYLLSFDKYGYFSISAFFEFLMTLATLLAISHDVGGIFRIAFVFRK